MNSKRHPSKSASESVSAEGMPLTSAIRRLIAINRSKGWLLLATFVDEVEDGTIPRTKTTLEMARRICRCLEDDKLDPQEVFKLRSARGRRPESAGERADAYHSSGGSAIAEALDKEPWPLPRGAVSKALNAVASSTRKDVRTLQRTWAKYSTSYYAMRKLVSDEKLISEFVTKAERKKYAKRDGRLLVALARERRKKGGI